MSISAKDIAKLEQVMKAEGPAHYRNRYVPGAEHVGIYRIFMIWPDKLKEVEEVDGEWREAAITFLEVNPRYFRSGNDKAQLLRVLKRANLSPKHSKDSRRSCWTWWVGRRASSSGSIASWRRDWRPMNWRRPFRSS